VASLNRPKAQQLNRSELEKLYTEKIREWNVSRKQLDAQGWKLLTVKEALKKCPEIKRELLEQSQGCVFIPYRDRDGKAITYATNKPFYSLRFLGKLPQEYVNGKLKEVRYRQPGDSSIHLYFAGRYEDSGPLHITEGPSKTEAATAAGYNTVGLISVSCWDTPELDALQLQDRDVFIVFDSDAATNVQVCIQQNKLARLLVERGARVRIVKLPDVKDLKKTGWDDFLRECGKEEFDQLLNEADDFSMSEALHKMNEEVRYIQEPSAIIRLDTRQVMHVRTFVNEAFAPRKHVDVKLVMTKEGPQSKLVEKRTAQAWIDWPGRRVVKCLDYRPGQDIITTSGGLNLWRGWGCEPKANKHYADLFTELVDFLCADIEDDHKKWFLQWLSYPLQNPGAKLRNAVVAWSTQQGVGKSLLAYLMKPIYGENFAEIGDDDLHSTFNPWAAGKQFILGEEITSRDESKFTVYNRLKSMISREKVRINVKYTPQYDVVDCLNYYFTSNSPKAFYLTDEDRRMFVFEVKGKPWDQKKYDRFLHWEQTDGPAAVFHYLLNEVDCTSFNPMARPPVTDAKLEMIESGSTDADDFARALRANTDAVTTNGAVVTKHNLYTITELYGFAKVFLHSDRHKYIAPKNLGQALSARGFRKVQCGDKGCICINGKYDYVWIVRDEERLADVTDVNKIRTEYIQERNK